jgi:hypothetical protein
MIPAPPGLVAQFKHTGEGPEGTYTYYEDHRVYAFDDDGTPLIVAQKPAPRLVPATRYSNYHGLAELAENDYIALIPGGGWRSKTEVTDENGKRWVYDQPLVAWALRRDGIVVPLETDGDGFVHEPEKTANSTHPVIYHPDQSWEEDAK